MSNQNIDENQNINISNIPPEPEPPVKRPIPIFKRKIVIFSAIVLLIVLIVGLLIMFFGAEVKKTDDVNVSDSSNNTNSAGDKQSWKTYYNEKYGFEFKYPEEFLLKNGKDVSTQNLASGLLFDGLDFKSNNGNGTLVLSVQIFSNSSQLSLNDYIISKNQTMQRSGRLNLEDSGWMYNKNDSMEMWSSGFNESLLGFESETYLLLANNSKQILRVVFFDMTSRSKDVALGTENYEEYIEILSTFKVFSDKTINYKTYNGPYPLTFIYPENLKLSEGDADYFSVIRISEGDKNEFDFKMRRQRSADEIIQFLEQDGFTIEKEIQVNNFPAVQLRGMATPNFAIPSRMVTKIVVQVDNQTYEISSWRADENDAIFQTILESINFIEKD